ncbi:MAG: transposase [Acidimicrobiales bacterium]
MNFDAAVLECRHRGHARVEDRVRCWKDCGLQNLPFASFTQNLASVVVSLLAGVLLAWTQMICLDGAFKVAEPKTLRYRLLHIGATLARRGRRLILRLDETWPWLARSGGPSRGCGPLSHNKRDLCVRSDNGESPEGATSDKSGNLRADAPCRGQEARLPSDHQQSTVRRRPPEVGRIFEANYHIVMTSVVATGSTYSFTWTFGAIGLSGPNHRRRRECQRSLSHGDSVGVRRGTSVVASASVMM